MTPVRIRARLFIAVTSARESRALHARRGRRIACIRDRLGQCLRRDLLIVEGHGRRGPTVPLHDHRDLADTGDARESSLYDWCTGDAAHILNRKRGGPRGGVSASGESQGGDGHCSANQGLHGHKSPGLKGCIRGREGTAQRKGTPSLRRRARSQPTARFWQSGSRPGEHKHYLPRSPPSVGGRRARSPQRERQALRPQRRAGKAQAQSSFRSTPRSRQC
ncbi:hypothetical protein GPLA_1396 [Paraglaciecola polaris LMG 21857]|uniref:Uncharacterized protein n=1 Tax=Paraglaciecola polaris LMG 21857 TaxID=1129793 RepID=K7AAB5_9ALTE|nr:hypothetical protein GPLA_1396 [Paraglaciecola polaris LMG 21857]